MLSNYANERSCLILCCSKGKLSSEVLLLMAEWHEVVDLFTYNDDG